MNILIINDLNAVAPGIAEVEERSIELCDAGLVQRASSSFLIVNNETEMTTIVGRLFTALLKGDELITKIDECHPVIFAAQLEFKELTIKG